MTAPTTETCSHCGTSLQRTGVHVAGCPFFDPRAGIESGRPTTYGHQPGPDPATALSRELSREKHKPLDCDGLLKPQTPSSTWSLRVEGELVHSVYRERCQGCWHKADGRCTHEALGRVPMLHRLSGPTQRVGHAITPQHYARCTAYDAWLRDGNARYKALQAQGREVEYRPTPNPLDPAGDPDDDLDDPRFRPTVAGHIASKLDREGWKAELERRRLKRVEENPCPECYGAGWVGRLYPNGHNEVTCEACGGTGEGETL